MCDMVVSAELTLTREKGKQIMLAVATHFIVLESSLVDFANSSIISWVDLFASAAVAIDVVLVLRIALCSLWTRIDICDSIS
jgi:hypothetical protein